MTNYSEMYAAEIADLVESGMTRFEVACASDAFGDGVSDEELEFLCNAAEEWLTENGGDDLSISVRRTHSHGEIPGTYARLSGGRLQFLGCSVSRPAVVQELTREAWEAAAAAFHKRLNG